MPELPEVETTRRSLHTPMFGARVEGIRVGKPLRWPLGIDPRSLRGHSVGALERRGKYLWMPLLQSVSSSTRIRTAASPPQANGGLLLHLGMSGSLAWHPGLPVDWPQARVHDHFDLITDRGVMRLTDPRRFGAVLWSPSMAHDPAAKLLAKLGVEPFDPALTPAVFHRALKAHRSAIKTVLLSGRVMVGAGNIYACEALHEAGIDPRLSARRISAARAERLLRALQGVLARAVDAGGTTLRDFRNAYGDAGAFQTMVEVYGREGFTCNRCQSVVKRVVQGGRSTFFCPGCQRR